MLNSTTSTSNLLTLIAVERERRRRASAQAHITPADFIARTQITTPQDEGAAAVPFILWPDQVRVLDLMAAALRLVILKARQLGISWLACAYALWLCTQYAGKSVLLFSQGQLEANDLIARMRFMADHYDGQLPALTTDNTAELCWANGSVVKSLPATRRAGRSFSASLIIFDEFAFMLFGASLYAAAKPTIDDGGKLFLISSADGQGTAYHQFWQAAQSGQNGFTPIFLPWWARPSRGPDWRDGKLIESYGDTATVLREYPANDVEAFAAAAGKVYDVWSDGPADGNVTEAADFLPNSGDCIWGVDDGYTGQRDVATGLYSAESHPRVIGLYQIRADGTICRFAETYAVKTLSERQIADTLALGYPVPDYAVVDSSAAELRGRLQDADIPAFGGTHGVEEGIKELRRRIAPDAQGRRLFLVHPRCVQFRAEMASYRRDPSTGKPIKQFDHGPDEARMVCWKLRYE